MIGGEFVKRLGLFALFFLLSLVFGCSIKGGNEVGSIEETLIATEKSLPDNFEQIATIQNQQQLFIVRVKNAKDYKEMWHQFQIKEELITIDTNKKNIYFIGLFESSSCPYEIEYLGSNTESGELEVHLSSEDGDCSADNSPRNFVLAIDKDISIKLSTLVVIKDSEKLELPIIDK